MVRNKYTSWKRHLKKKLSRYIGPKHRDDSYIWAATNDLATPQRGIFSSDNEAVALAARKADRPVKSLMAPSLPLTVPRAILTQARWQSDPQSHMENGAGTGQSGRGGEPIWPCS